MSDSPLGIYWSVGTFFPSDLPEVGEHETAHSVLKVLKRIPDACNTEDGLARMHWRFKREGEARVFWEQGCKHFQALPWSLLQNPAWVAEASIPNTMPEDL